MIAPHDFYDGVHVIPLRRAFEMMRTIKAHSPQSWAHINMLGEYDFSDKKLADSFGILPLKTSP